MQNHQERESMSPTFNDAAWTIFWISSFRVTWTLFALLKDHVFKICLAFFWFPHLKNKPWLSEQILSEIYKIFEYFKGTLMEIWKFHYIFGFLSKQYFRILNLKNSRVVYPWSLNFSLKVVYFLAYSIVSVYL